MKVIHIALLSFVFFGCSVRDIAENGSSDNGERAGGTFVGSLRTSTPTIPSLVRIVRSYSASISTTATSLGARCDSLSKAISNLEVEQAKLNTDSQGAIGERHTQEEAKEASQSRLDSLRSQSATLTVERTKLQNDISSAGASFNAYVEGLREQLRQAKLALPKLKRDLSILQAKNLGEFSSLEEVGVHFELMSTKKASIAGKEEEIRQLTNTLASPVRPNVSAAEDRIRVITTELSSLAGSIRSEESNLRSIEASLVSINARINRLSGPSNAVSDQIKVRPAICTQIGH